MKLNRNPWYKRHVLLIVLSTIILFTIITDISTRLPEIKGTIGNGYIIYDTVEGVITQSSTRLYGTGKSVRKGIDIYYGYQLGSEIYVSKVITFAADYFEIDKYLSKYPEGKKVTVYYQRSNPEFSVLEPNITNWGLVFRPFRIFLVVILGLLIVVAQYCWENRVKGDRSI